MAIYQFNRYEVKYVLHKRQVDQIIAEMKGRIELDPNAGDQGFYRNISVYYDTYDLRFYWEKIEGEKVRSKIRLRGYMDSNGTFIGKSFLEIKQRNNLIVHKRRAKIPFDDGMHFMETGQLDKAYRSKVSDEVHYLRKKFDLRPMLSNYYHRQPFVGCRDFGFRITFDSHMKVCHGYQGLAGWENGRYLLSPELVIMELKFNERMPAWVSMLLAKHNLSLRRVSKYCLGIEKLRKNFRSIM